MTLTQRTRWRPLAQVCVLTGLRKVLDMIAPAPDMEVRRAGKAGQHNGGCDYGADCGHAPSGSLTYLRHSHAHRDQAPTIRASASETDSAVSPIDKAPNCLDPTLHLNTSL